MFEEVAKQLGVEHKIYRPQGNGRIEGFHKFLKECISKHMVGSLEWDDILPLGCHCTLTVNHERITDLQWQATDKTLPDNLAEIAGKAGEISEIISTQLLFVVNMLKKFCIIHPSYWL